MKALRRGGTNDFILGCIIEANARGLTNPYDCWVSIGQMEYQRALKWLGDRGYVTGHDGLRATPEGKRAYYVAHNRHSGVVDAS